MADKKVEVEVVTDAELTEVQALENEINKIKRQKLELDIEANTSKLQETEKRIESLKIFLDTVNTGNTNIHIDDSDIKKAENELDQLESKKLDIQLAIEKDKLDAVKTEVDDLDGTEIDLNIDNSTALQAVDQISQGFDRLKQGAIGIGQQLGVALEAAGKQETNKTFLEMSVGAEQAAKSMEQINNVVQKLPGDDTALQGLLSSAAAKNAGMTADEMERMGVAAADYFAAMEYYGKSATEAQQDMTNYILAGNTAELERSPILQSHIDKLKEANTPQERALALQQALKEEGWAGMSQQDTYNNKLATFNGMLERGKYNLGGMFQEGAKGAMDFLLKLDESTNGLVGMTIALGSFASPITDTLMGLGQMATGIKAIKDLGFIKWLKDLELAQKASAAAQWLLNASFWSNPITIIVLAIIALIAVLGYLYFNNEQVRAAIDGLGQTLQWVAGVIYNSLVGAFEWLSSVFQNFTSQIGLNTSDWKQAVLGFILFLPQLPLRVGQLLLDTIARALGFGDNFTSTMVNGAVNAVNGFINWITSLPGKLWAELQKMLDMASNFAMEIADKLTFGGASMVAGWLSGSGEHSPGFMYDALIQELLAMLNAPEMLSELVTGIGDKGYEMANALSEAILGVDIDTAIMGWIQTFGGLQDYMLTLGGLLPQSVDITGNKIIDTLLRVMGFIGTLPLQLGMHLTNMIAQALGFGNNFSQRMFSAGANAVSNFARSISNLSSGLVNELNDMISDALNFAGRIGQILWDAGINAITNFLNALDRHSPGIMQRELIAEITETGERVPIASQKLLTNMSRLGGDIVDNFGNPKLKLDFETANADVIGNINNATTHHKGDLTINIYGDVDSEKRINDIIDAITKAMAWDNKTAGRTS